MKDCYTRELKTVHTSLSTRSLSGMNSSLRCTVDFREVVFKCRIQHVAQLNKQTTHVAVIYSVICFVRAVSAMRMSCHAARIVNYLTLDRTY